MLYVLNEKTNGNFDRFPEIDDGSYPPLIDEFNEYYTSMQS